MTALRVLGIDPGSRITGVGVVEADGQALRHIHSACIRVGEGDLGPRLARIYRGVADVIDQHGPEEVALEQDRKSTRLNSSHALNSYAVFCLKTKTEEHTSELQSLVNLVCRLLLEKTKNS